MQLPHFLAGLYRHLLIPAFETGLKRRKTFHYLRALERSQWLSPNELEAMQFTALQGLVRHAFANCPYYRESWSDLSLAPTRLREPADLRLWPVMDRGAINANRLRMRAPGWKLIAKSTGGSSGVPLHFDLDTGSYDRRNAAWHRGYGWAGAAPGTKQLYLWGIPLAPRGRLACWKDDLFNRMNRRHVVNSFGMSDTTLPAMLDQLNRCRPDVIVAYVNPLYAMARWLGEHRLVPWSPRSIVVGAEKLHLFQRQLIEQVFQAPVFETYGSREFMLIGGECDRHAGLHLTAEHLLVEILDANGNPAAPGTEGDLVITDLFNYGMPFIRYRIGDRAVAGSSRCSCGRGLPILKEVTGRRLDLVHTPDGRMIPGEFFPHLLKDYSAIKEFQIVQMEADCVRLDVVLGPTWTSTQEHALMLQLAEILGPAMRLALRPVTHIALTPAGKRRVVVNQVTAQAV